MKKLLETLQRTLAEGRGAVVCTIVDAGGSTPRGPGAQMLVTADGVWGTVGGGAAEHLTELAAAAALREGRSRVERFDMHPGQADIGMVCGGEIAVALHYFAGGDGAALSLLDAALPLLDGGGEAWLVTRMEPDGPWRTGLFDPAHGLRFLPGVDAGAAISGRGEWEETGLYAAPLVRGGTVFIFGGGHVAAELAAALVRVDFRVAVWDDRPAFADPGRFPGAAEVVCGDYAGVGTRLALRPWDCAAVMTHGHRADFEVLRQVLPTEAGYVGCIGSRTKHAFVCQRLREAGFAEADIRRIHSPIGLPILAQTPAEIAVSIAAELIAHRAKRLKAGD